MLDTFEIRSVTLKLLKCGEISPTRCNNCVFYSQWLYSTCFEWQSHPSSGVRCCIWPQVSWLTVSSEPPYLWPYTASYSWWWVRLSPETCRVKPLRIKNAIVASCWTYFTTIKHDARNHKYEKKFEMWCWGRTEMISWTDSVKNEEEFYRNQQEMIILQYLDYFQLLLYDNLFRSPLILHFTFVLHYTSSSNFVLYTMTCTRSCSYSLM